MKILNEKQCEKIMELAVSRTADYIKENNISGITEGISGGIDSAIVAVITLKVIEKLKQDGYDASYKFVFLDCESEPNDYKKAKVFASEFKFEMDYLDLTGWYKSSPLLDLIPEGHKREKISRANIKCRLRMISLYNFASLNNHIYLDTDDYSEELMGFWTKHGDEGDVKIIQHLTKTEMYDLGEFLGVPETILKSDPGDGLNVTKGSLAKDQLGLDYIYIEYIMNRFVEEGFDYNGSSDQLENEKYKKLIMKVSEEINQSEDKIVKILNQSLKTAFKRKYGDNVCHILPNRKELSLSEFGTKEFGKVYLGALLGGK